MVIMQLKLVKYNTVDEAAVAENGTEPSGGVNHVIKVLKELVDPWVGKGDRMVESYSYFASMLYTSSLEDTGIGFIGVLEQASCKY